MKNIACAILVLITQHGAGQSMDEDAIRKNAVAISKFDTTDSRLAEIFKDKKLIMVGELHGTAEPAEFVNYLVQNLAGKGRGVYVGLEISPEQIVATKDLSDSLALRNSPFFSSESFGKASQAWLHLILSVSQLKDVHLFFFNVTKDQGSGGKYNYDSLMYVNIKSKMEDDGQGVYICLSGNFHNKLTGAQVSHPLPMRYYLLHDKVLRLTMSNMVSFNHLCVEGQDYNNTGDGTHLHNLKYNDNYYAITGLRNYFFISPQLIDDYYNGILFTYHVTASQGFR